MQLCRERNGERLAADHQALQARECGFRHRVGNQHAGHGRGALQVGGAGALDQRGDGFNRLRSWSLRRRADLIEQFQTLQDRSLRDAEVYQAADLIDADPADPFDDLVAAFGSPEQTARLVVPLEGVFEKGAKLLRREAGEEVGSVTGGRGPVLERGEGPRELLDQAHRAAQVLDHRLTHDGLDFFIVRTDEGVQHEGDMPFAGMSCSLPGRAVHGYPLCYFR